MCLRFYICRTKQITEQYGCEYLQNGLVGNNVFKFNFKINKFNDIQYDHTEFVFCFFHQTLIKLMHYRKPKLILLRCISQMFLYYSSLMFLYFTVILLPLLRIVSILLQIFPTKVQSIKMFTIE